MGQTGGQQYIDTSPFSVPWSNDLVLLSLGVLRSLWLHLKVQVASMSNSYFSLALCALKLISCFHKKINPIEFPNPTCKLAHSKFKG
jgi:hypothetical protein